MTNALELLTSALKRCHEENLKDLRLIAERDDLGDDLAHAKRYIETLTAERDEYKGMYEAAHAMRGDAEVEALKAEAENAALREGLDGWHARHLDMEVEFARLVDVCHAAKLRLAAENAALRDALVWIATVNAMDYEYTAKARAAIGEKT